MNRALFCLDIQIDHFPMGMLEVKDANRLIPAINELTTDFKEVFIFKAYFSR